jgi:aldehyde dehydrogenase (NAD+)|tara:strand:+ start:8757 stop:10142 length:1386 start_codon:yes stop_codon:yes gene_type:complete
VKKLDLLLAKQQLYFQKELKQSHVKSRVSKIRKIRNWIIENENYIVEHCLKDYSKPVSEFYTTEYKTVLNHINFVLRNISKWVVAKSVWTPIHLLGTKSRVFYEAKGVCLIISPWNYPFNLTLNPLISAIAAGNCVVVKPSEFTPNTSMLINQLVSSIFKEDEIKVIEGDYNVGNYLINLNFDHIFFTGSPKIGKVVMAAAAANLSSVTLELGGKNHTIVDETADLKDAAEKILWSKYVNSGQTCIAVNHVFVHSSSYMIFLKHLQEVLRRFFCDSSVEYGEIVNTIHHKRISALLKKCLDHSGAILTESKIPFSSKNAFPLTVIEDVSIDNPILSEEIFGPLLPVIVYDDFDSILNFISSENKALALYLFSKSNKNIKSFLNSTSSGTVAINDCMLQYANPHLPFGGVNTSGMGKTGGLSGFLEFSNQKSVLFQKSGFSIAKLIYPPYTNFKKKLAKILG